VIDKAYPELDYDVLESSYIRNKLFDYDYAQKFYAALCNNHWKKEGFDYANTEPWAVTWRTAGGITSSLFNGSDLLENYMDFYCSGNEGAVDSEVEQDLFELGWHHEPIELTD
jgi:hypothetical protein